MRAKQLHDLLEVGHVLVDLLHCNQIEGGYNLRDVEQRFRQAWRRVQPAAAEIPDIPGREVKGVLLVIRRDILGEAGAQRQQAVDGAIPCPSIAPEAQS